MIKRGIWACYAGTLKSLRYCTISVSKVNYFLSSSGQFSSEIWICLGVDLISFKAEWGFECVTLKALRFQGIFLFLLQIKHLWDSPQLYIWIAQLCQLHNRMHTMTFPTQHYRLKLSWGQVLITSAISHFNKGTIWNTVFCIGDGFLIPCLFQIPRTQDYSLQTEIDTDSSALFFLKVICGRVQTSQVWVSSDTGTVLILEQNTAAVFDGKCVKSAHTHTYTLYNPLPYHSIWPIQG